MDKDSLRHTVAGMEKKLDQLAEILENHEQRFERDPSATFDPRLCLSFVQELRRDLDEDCEIAAEKQENLASESRNLILMSLESASEMIHHISDRVIKDTVDRLADTMRSNSPPSQFARNMVDQFFEGPEGDQRRKDIEHKLKKKFGWERLGSSDCSGSFAYEVWFKDALIHYEYVVQKAALEYAADDINAMVAAITRT